MLMIMIPHAIREIVLVGGNPLALYLLEMELRRGGLKIRILSKSS
jgi:hypothetical protein